MTNPIENFITCEVTPDGLAAAQKLFQYLDPDVGGALSFGTQLANGNWLASMPADPDLIAKFKPALADAKKMAELAAADYAKRWEPTHDEKEAAKTDPKLAEKQRLMAEADAVALQTEITVDLVSVQEAMKYREIVIKGDPVKTDPVKTETVVKQ